MVYDPQQIQTAVDAVFADIMDLIARANAFGQRIIVGALKQQYLSQLHTNLPKSADLAEGLAKLYKSVGNHGQLESPGVRLAKLFLEELAAKLGIDERFKELAGIATSAQRAA